MAGALITITKGTTDITAQTAGLVNGDFLAFSEGNQSVTAGFGAGSTIQALAGGLDLFIVSPAFTGNLGGTSGAFKFDADYSASSRVVYNAGGGTFFVEAAGGSAVITRCQQIGRGSLYTTGGTFTTLEVASGSTSVNASTIVTNYFQHGGTASILNNATAITAATIGGGKADIQRSITTLTVAGDASVNVFREDSSLAAPTATTVNVYGGTLLWRGGNITTANVFGLGKIDFSMAQAALTVGTLNIDERARQASTLQSPFATVTITTANIRGGTSTTLGG